MNKSKGITLIEVMTTIAILAVISGISVSFFSKLSNAESLDKDVSNILSQLEKAKTQAINSIDNSEYGVKFTSTSVTLFTGKVYSESASTNFTYNLSSKNEIATVSLSGGAMDLYFNRLTGKPSHTGTITVREKSGESEKVISIYASGLSDV